MSTVEIQTLFDAGSQPIQHSAQLQLFDRSAPFKAIALRQLDGSWVVREDSGASVRCSDSAEAVRTLRAWREMAICRQYANHMGLGL